MNININLDSNPSFFFILTYVYSWSFWLIAICFGGNYLSFPTGIFYLLGGIGPSFVGILLLYKNKSKEEIRDFWNRSIDFKLIGRKWYGAIFGIWLFIILLSGLIGLIIQGEFISFDIELISNPIWFIIYTFILIIGVLAEEFGWRGYAQQELQKKYSNLIATTLIGILWSIWHLPLYFIQGTFQNTNGFGSTKFWLYSLNIIPEAFIYAWIYNKNNRSILSAILFHFFGNLIGELFVSTKLVLLVRVIITFLIAITIILTFGKDLNSKEEN